MSINVTFTVEDGKGQKSPVTINLPTTTSATDAVAFAKTAWPLVSALIEGGNVVGRVSFEVDGLTSGNPVGGADVQEIGRFIFNTVGGFTKSLGLPTFLESLIQPGTDLIDTADTDVAAFVTMMTDGIDTTGEGGSGVIQPSDYRSEDLDALTGAIEAWGRAR
jgi:hypothetical protein